MKNSLKIAAALVAAILLFTGNSIAQQTPKAAKKAADIAALKKQIEDRKFTFVPEYALPQRGETRYLTPDYDLRVTKDSVIAYLPYFGRVYMDVSINPEDAGIKFTSTKFDYQATQTKKGDWSIVITLMDVRRSSKLRLDIGSSGYSSLQVLSNSRDEISFNGYIKESH